MSGERILIVDDMEDLVNHLASVLSYEGYKVSKAYEGAEGIRGPSKTNLISFSST